MMALKASTFANLCLVHCFLQTMDEDNYDGPYQVGGGDNLMVGNQQNERNSTGCIVMV
jgi:hypothetical protein